MTLEVVWRNANIHGWKTLFMHPVCTECKGLSLDLFGAVSIFDGFVVGGSVTATLANLDMSIDGKFMKVFTLTMSTAKKKKKKVMTPTIGMERTFFVALCVRKTTHLPQMNRGHRENIFAKPTGVPCSLAKKYRCTKST